MGDVIKPFLLNSLSLGGYFMLRLFFYGSLCLNFWLVLPLYADTTEYRFQQFFPLLSHPWYFNEAHDIAVDWENNIYIADTSNNSIKKLSADGLLMMQLRMPTDTMNIVPRNIMVDRSNRVYVSYRVKEPEARIDKVSRIFCVFNNIGELLHEWSYKKFIISESFDQSYNDFFNSENFEQAYNNFLSSENSKSLYSVFFNSESFEQLYIDFLNSESFEPSYIDFFNSENHAQAYRDFINSKSYEWSYSDFLGPENIAVDSQGYIYFSTQDDFLIKNQQIRRFSPLAPQGEPISAWDVTLLDDEWELPHLKNEQEKGKGPNISDMAIDSQDFLYLLDSRAHRVRKYSSDGELIHYWGGFGSAPGQFDLPDGISIDKHNNIYVADRNNSRVQMFTTEGEYITSFANRLHPDAEIWDAAVKSSPIGKMLTLLLSEQLREYIGNLVSCEDYTSSASCFKKLLNGVFGKASVATFDTFNMTTPWPHAVAIDPETSEIYVGYSYPGNAIHKYQPNGDFVQEWSSKQLFNTPFNVLMQETEDNDIASIWVTDILNHRVVRLAPNGTELDTLGGMGLDTGKFVFPTGLAKDSQGNMYVVDTGNTRIQKFDAEGNFLLTWGEFDKEFETLLNDDLLEIFVSKNLERISADKIPLEFAIELMPYLFLTEMKVEPALSLFIQNKLENTESKDFILPVGIAIDEHDHVYVTDLLKSRIFKFDSQGNLLNSFGKRAPAEAETLANDEFHAPVGITTDAQNRVYITDIYAHTIKVFDANGTYLAQYGAKGEAIRQLKLPLALAVDAAGHLYVTDSENHRLQKLTLNADRTQIASALQIGTQGTTAGQLNQPGGLAVSQDGKTVFVTDMTNNRIQRFEQANFNPGKAIIVVGWLEGSDDLQNNLQTLANFAYRVLQQKGFRTEEIRYLSPNTGLDLDDDGKQDVYDTSTLKSVEEAIQWASDSDNLTLYLLDHGRADHFRVNAQQSLSAAVLKELLKVNTTVIYEACESGSFVYKLAEIEGKNLILITSASSTQTASLPGEGALSFSSYFWREIANGADIRHAFEAGQNAMGEQAPQLNANGNTQANEPADLVAVENRHIGNPNPTRSGNPPEIHNLNVTPESLTETTIATISVDIYSTYPITKVVALVHPPTSAERSSDAVLDLPQFTLEYIENQRYAANYDGFTRNGEYLLSIYAYDSKQQISQPVVTKVTVAGHDKRPKAMIIGGLDAAAGDLLGANNALKNQAYAEEDTALYATDNAGSLPITTQIGLDVLEYALHPDNQQNTSTLVIYLEAAVIQGTADTIEIVLNATENMSASIFASWLDNLQNTLDIPLTLILSGERSGLLLPFLAKENRMVIASTGPDGVATNCPALRTFSRLFWTHIFYGVPNTYEAFVKTKIEYDALIDEFCEPTNNQKELDRWLPHLNANGKDVRKAEERREAMQYASAHNMTSGVITASNTPFISALPSNIFLNSQNQLTLRVPAVKSANRQIHRVWAEIIPYDAESQPIEELELLPDVTCGYSAEYNNLQAGKPYLIRYRAEDSAGEQAPPVFMRLSRIDQTTPLLSQNNVYQTCQQLRLELPTLGQGYKRYLAVQLPDASLFALSAPNQFEPLNVDALHTMPVWSDNELLALNMPIIPGFPTGEYTIYQVDIPKEAKLSPALLNSQTLKEVTFHVQ